MINFAYVNTVNLTGDLQEDSTKFLCRNGKKETAAHSVNVARTCAELANRFDLDYKPAYQAALLHDISAVIKPQDMMCYAKSQDWYIDESEKRYPFLLHQRISVEISRRYFNVSDKTVLSAIECHSTLKVNPSEYDMILFLSDKISWDQEGIPPFYDVLLKALEVSLAHSSLTYINYVLDNGMILYPHKWLIEAKEWLQLYHMGKH